MIRKWITKRVVEPMILNFLEKHDMTLCRMCEGLAPIAWEVCDYCSYELEMMNKQSYEEAMLG